MKVRMNRLLPKSSRVALALAALVTLGGCVSYYERHYDDPGVYYSGGYQSAVYRPVRPPNPAVYPYWSLDYFYFSRYHHPYSVFVGYHEPLYYPYPGWYFGGRYASHRYGYRPGFRTRLGFGYPWYGYGHSYPRFSLGFFVGYDVYRGHRGYGYRHDHRLRHIDRRLNALQDPAPAPSRASLVDRSQRAGAPLRSQRYSDTRQSPRQRSATPPASRAALLRGRAASNAGAIDRAGRMRSAVPTRSGRVEAREPRNASRPAIDSGRSLRRSSAGSATARERNARASRSAPAEIRRQREVRPRANSAPPDRRGVLSSGRGSHRPASAPATPRIRSRSAPPPRVEPSAQREVSPRSRPIRPARSVQESRSRIRADRGSSPRGARDAGRSERGSRGNRGGRADRNRLRDRPD